MPVLFKEILPAKFNDKAIYQQLLKGMNDTVDFAQKIYDNSYKDFSRKPIFEKEIKQPIGSIKGEYLTEDTNYKRLNSGTKQHVIRPKRPGGFLVFNATFKSKTTPERTISRRGFSKPPLIFAKKVNHPGFPARNYTTKINKRSEAVFNRSVKVALKLGAKKSGHSI